MKILIIYIKISSILNKNIYIDYNGSLKIMNSETGIKEKKDAFICMVKIKPENVLPLEPKKAGENQC